MGRQIAAKAVVGELAVVVLEDAVRDDDVTEVSVVGVPRTHATHRQRPRLELHGHPRRQLGRRDAGHRGRPGRRHVNRTRGAIDRRGPVVRIAGLRGPAVDDAGLTCAQRVTLLA